MKHFFDILDKDISPYNEFVKLRELYEENFFYFDFNEGYSLRKLIEDNVFMQLSFRGSCITIDELEENLNFEDDMFVDSNYVIDDLFCYCEYLNAILTESRYELEKYPNGIERVDMIFQNINFILEKTNHEWYVLPENYRSIIIEKKGIADAAISLSKNENLNNNLKQYLNHNNKGNLENKRNILTVLAREIEPILNSRVLSKNKYKDLESDIGYLLNNFHIRHNNVEGTKESKVLENISDSELEEWYDKTYYLITSTGIIKKTIEISQELNELKNKE